MSGDHNENGASTMNLASLNEDILIGIISFVSPEDAWKLSSLSRFLHFVAMPRALSAVTLTKRSQTILFCEYMLADVENRLCWLQSLEVYDFALKRIRNRQAVPASHTAKRLGMVVRQARNMKRLVIEDVDFIANLIPPPEVLDKLVELDLPVSNSWTPAAIVTSPRFCMTLRRLHLTIDISTGLETPFSLLEYIAPLTALDTLELTLFDEEHLGGRDVVLRVPPLPCVRCLRLRTCDLPISVLARVLPNVRELHLDNVENSSSDEEAYRWPALDYASGLSPYMGMPWVLFCLVRSLQIVVECENLRLEGDGGALVLRDVMLAAPKMLSLDLSSNCTELGPPFYANLAAIATELRYLELELSWSEFPSWMVRHLPMLCCGMPD